jgi:hypothetical protein
MAYMSQVRKAQIAEKVRPILKRYGVKGSLSVRHHSTIVLTLKSGRIDFISNLNSVCGGKGGQYDGFRPVTNGHCDVNPYWFQEHFDGVAKKFLTEVLAALNLGNHNRSDVQTDYFDVGWYVDVNVGKWNKPYIVQ